MPQKCLVRLALETINKEKISYQNQTTSPEKKNGKCMVLRTDRCAVLLERPSVMLKLALKGQVYDGFEFVGKNWIIMDNIFGLRYSTSVS